MPTKQGGRALKNASTSDRCRFRRNTALPAASTPCSWKTRLAMSKPTVVIFMVEAPSVRCTQRPELGTSMPSGVVHRIRFYPLDALDPLQQLVGEDPTVPIIEDHLPVQLDPLLHL